MASVVLVMCNNDLVKLVDELTAGGLCVVRDQRYSEPEASLESPQVLRGLDPINVHVLKPEWVYGPFKFMKGNSDYLFLQPRVNFSAFSLSYYGTREKGGVTRLGFADMDTHPTWLELPQRVLHRAPPDVGTIFKSLVAELKRGSQSIRLPGGQRRIIMTYALQKFRLGSHLMPDPHWDHCAKEQIGVE